MSKRNTVHTVQTITAVALNTGALTLPTGMVAFKAGGSLLVALTLTSISAGTMHAQLQYSKDGTNFFDIPPDATMISTGGIAAQAIVINQSRITGAGRAVAGTDIAYYRNAPDGIYRLLAGDASANTVTMTLTVAATTLA